MIYDAIKFNIVSSFMGGVSRYFFGKRHDKIIFRFYNVMNKNKFINVFDYHCTRLMGYFQFITSTLLLLVCLHYTPLWSKMLQNKKITVMPIFLKFHNIVRRYNYVYITCCILFSVWVYCHLSSLSKLCFMYNWSRL